MRVAIPTNNPGGLGATRSDHFGHADVFTVITIDDELKLGKIEVVANVAHEAGGCMAPVKVLSDAAVEAIVVGGMGARPMKGFSDAGIKVYFANTATIGTVQEVYDGFVKNMLPLMSADQVCKGSGNCNH
ncbi:MAG: dinitrogenase iron-molybdenum cofactor biosynthesis protein [Desulfotalea sp.]